MSYIPYINLRLACGGEDDLTCHGNFGLGQFSEESGGMVEVEFRIPHIHGPSYSFPYSSIPYPTSITLYIFSSVYCVISAKSYSITGRTTAYLFDPEKSSLTAKKRVATVQCHELAHMWFGDIVTMKWWDNLWLNEVRENKNCLLDVADQAGLLVETSSYSKDVS